jgi:hypothetical protein
LRRLLVIGFARSAAHRGMIRGIEIEPKEPS